MIVSYPSEKLASTGRLQIEIELNYSKKKLTDEFKRVLSEWKVIYENVQKRNRFEQFCEDRNITSE